MEPESSPKTATKHNPTINPPPPTTSIVPPLRPPPPTLRNYKLTLPPPPTTSIVPPLLCFKDTELRGKGNTRLFTPNSFQRNTKTYNPPPPTTSIVPPLQLPPYTRHNSNPCDNQSKQQERLKQNKSVEYTHNKNKTNHLTPRLRPLFLLFHHSFQTPDRQRSRQTDLQCIQSDTNKRNNIKRADTVADTDDNSDDSYESLPDPDADDNCSNVSVLSVTDPKLFQTRQHSPSLPTDVDPKVTPRRRRRNLARIDYCVDDTLSDVSDHLAIPLTPDAEPRIDQTSIGWEHFIRGRLSLSFTPIIADYYRANKLGRRFTTKKWFSAVIASLFDIHQQAWREFCSATTRTNSTNKITFPPKKTLLCLVETYYKLSGTLRKLQKKWFARPITSFASWTVDELRYWLRTAKRILTKKN